MKTQANRGSSPIQLLLVGGGSGGHVTPLVALAKEVKKQQSGWQLSYIGASNDTIGQRLIRGQAQLFTRTHFLPAGKFRRFGRRGWSFWSRLGAFVLNLRDLAKAVAGVVGSLYLLFHNRPHLVFSKGGYSALGPCLAARILRIPLIVHDSDAVPGLTHRVVGRWAKLRLTGLPTLSPQPQERYVGVPVVPRLAQPLSEVERQALLASYDLDPEVRLVLIFGGGQGAVNLNQALIDVLDELKLPPRAHFILVTGSANYQSTVALAADLKRRPRLTLLGFVDNLPDLIRAAEVVVTRAGATALAEVTVAAKPTIIIPKPFMPGNHQVHNANIYRQAGAAVVVADNGQRVNRRAFVTELEGLLSSSSRRRELGMAIARLAKTAAVTQTLESIREVLARQLRSKSVVTRDWARYYLRYRNLMADPPNVSSEARRRQQLRSQWRLGTWLAVGLVVLVGVRLLYIGDIRVAVEAGSASGLITETQIADLEREVATNLAPGLWPYPSTSDWLSRRFRPRFDEIKRELLNRHPYLESIGVRRDWWLSEATLVVKPQPIVGVVRYDRQAAVLLANGVVLGGYPTIVGDPSLVTIWVAFDLGEVVGQRPILSAAEIGFIQQIRDYFNGQDQQVENFRLSENPKEFIVKLADYDFEVITTTLADPVAQSVATNLALEFLDSREDLERPDNYLDVRLVELVVYR